MKNDLTSIQKQLSTMLNTEFANISSIKVSTGLVDFKHGDTWMWAKLSKDGKKVRKNTIRIDVS